ncbi:MAG: hypothetical protein MJ095_04380 [Oscillospiraceae bacterium]|nr:hypothetical protein [Oscillospiraceae bacterium]
MSGKNIYRYLNRRTATAGLIVVIIIVLFSFAFGKEKVHLYKSVVTSQGDCVTPGLRTFVCIRCSYKRTEPVVGGHKYSDTLVVNLPEGKKHISRRCSVCGGEASEDVDDYKVDNPYSLVFAEVTGIEKIYNCTGQAIVPEPVVKDRSGEILTENEDYTVIYQDNTDSGIALVRITGAGRYSGACDVHFKIADVYWDETDGLKYYYENGKPVTGRKVIDGSEYFFSEDGVMQTGWQLIDEKYYCYDRITGELAVNTQVDGIDVDKTGAAEETDYNIYKIETMMKAHRIVLEQTAPAETMEEKRIKLFNWEMKEHGYHRWRILTNVWETSPDWEITFANDIFDNGTGCCVSDACATAFLFREIGYSDIYICHDTSHCWFTVEGKLFDPLFAETKSFENNFDAKFTDYRARPVGRRRVDGVSTETETDDEPYVTVVTEAQEAAPAVSETTAAQEVPAVTAAAEAPEVTDMPLTTGMEG